jgi:hypothetical protein
MFESLSRKGCGLLVAAAILIPTLLVFLWLAGSAVVVDQTGGVTAAVVVDGGGTEQPLHRLWRGHFFAIPDMKGVIEVRCSNGVRKQIGYVTEHMHTKVKVIGRKPCERVVEG